MVAPPVKVPGPTALKHTPPSKQWPHRVQQADDSFGAWMAGWKLSHHCLWSQIQSLENHLLHFLVVGHILGGKSVHSFLCQADQAVNEYHHPSAFRPSSRLCCSLKSIQEEHLGSLSTIIFCTLTVVLMPASMVYSIALFTLLATDLTTCPHNCLLAWSWAVTKWFSMAFCWSALCWNSHCFSAASCCYCMANQSLHTPRPSSTNSPCVFSVCSILRSLSQSLYNSHPLSFLGNTPGHIQERPL